MRDFILFILTLIACIYGIYCKRMWDIYEEAFRKIVAHVYKPVSEKQVDLIIEELFNDTKIKTTNKRK